MKKGTNRAVSNINSVQRIILLLGIVFLVVQPLSVPAGGQKSSEQGEPIVFVSIGPQRYLVQSIAGSRIRVEVLVQSGQDPHTFEPTPKQMAQLSRGRLYFRIGVAFERSLIPRIRSSNPQLKIIDTQAGIELREIEEGNHEGEDHDEHGLDPHTWLSPLLAKRQAQIIRDALIEADPGGREEYEAGYRNLAAELDSLHEEIAAVLAPYRGEEIFVYHPAYGYFTDEYGLRQVAVETGGSEPSAQQLARLIERARERQVRIIFVQPQFSRTGAEAVAEAIGGVVVPLDPLAEDYVENLREMARKIAEALE
ncbi:MAG: zinc ABC transporter substrate-binding protein [Spirochaetia bacterium]